jgi:cyclophilin family peptidyl-prolyl cis-trans isomerase
MARHGCLGGAGLAIGLALAATGCNSASDTTAEAKPAAINGSSAQGPDLASANGSAAQANTAKSTADLQHPVVKIETSLGDLVVRLDRERAPLTVENFLSYVANGFYDQTIFHQVQKNYVILGGGFTSQLVEKQARAAPVRNEAALRNAKKNTRGTIAMARRADIVDSSTCQFFINLADSPQLDHKESKPGQYGPPEEYGYCTFGEVTEGMDVVEQISAVPVQDKGDFERIPAQTVLIKSIRRIQ